MMQIHAELCHVDTLRCVVRVEARDGDLRLGSALGEAQTSEAAEDRALERLRLRLNPPEPTPVTKTDSLKPPAIERSTAQKVEKVGTNEKVQTGSPKAPDPQSVPDAPSESPTDPEDWSDELAAVDLEIRRIGWDRDMERQYLERAFGFGSRHRLTRYSDLTGYLRQLRVMKPGARPETAAVPIRRSELIEQGNVMLKELAWSADNAREFLNQQLGANSRQQLSDEQLLQFNMLLEEQLINRKS